MTINTLTQGHRRLLAQMGFPKFLVNRMGEAGDESRAPEKREEAVIAALWIASRPLDDVRPGGAVASAVKTGTWERLLREWEFELTQARLSEFPPLFWEACELSMPIPERIPAEEPEVEALPEVVEAEGADEPEPAELGVRSGAGEVNEEPCEACQ